MQPKGDNRSLATMMWVVVLHMRKANSIARWPLWGANYRKLGWGVGNCCHYWWRWQLIWALERMTRLVKVELWRPHIVWGMSATCLFANLKTQALVLVSCLQSIIALQIYQSALHSREGMMKSSRTLWRNVMSSDNQRLWKCDLGSLCPVTHSGWVHYIRECEHCSLAAPCTMPLFSIMHPPLMHYLLHKNLQPIYPCVPLGTSTFFYVVVANVANTTHGRKQSGGGQNTRRWDSMSEGSMPTQLWGNCTKYIESKEGPWQRWL